MKPTRLDRTLIGARHDKGKTTMHNVPSSRPALWIYSTRDPANWEQFYRSANR